MDTPVYRFRVIAGPQSGRSFSIGEKGALIGRSENCDIILLDPSLSRHHCRIFLRDGLLWVADLKSANSTDVDGVPVQEAPLWKDRRIMIGDTVILVEADTGARHPSSIPPSRRHPVALAITAALVACALAVLSVHRLRSASPSSDQSNGAPSAPNENATIPFLAADYYRIQADTGTIRTMHFQILPPDLATIRIEDLAAKRELRRTVTIPRYQTQLLARHFTDSGFFTLTSATESDSPSSEVRISAFVQGRHHTVRNPPQGGSASFRNLAAQIEETAAVLFGNWIQDFTDANLLALAKRQFTAAREKADVEQRNRHNHLYTAIQDLEYATWLLQPIRPQPDLATAIQQTLTAYRDALDAHIRDIFSEADRAARHNDYAIESEALQLILERLPDERDLRYRTAAQRLATLPPEGVTADVP